MRGLKFIPSLNLIYAIVGRDMPPKEYASPLTVDWVLALPEIEFNPSIHGQQNTAPDSSSSPPPSSPRDEEQVGTDATSIQHLPNDNNMLTNTRCSVCLNDFDAGEKVRMLPCSHLYHLDCILPWLTACRGECPLCKQRVLHSNINASIQNVDETPNHSATVPLDENGMHDGVVIDIRDEESRDVRREDEYSNSSNNSDEMKSHNDDFTLDNANKVEMVENKNCLEENNDDEMHSSGRDLLPTKLDEKEGSNGQDPSLAKPKTDESSEGQDTHTSFISEEENAEDLHVLTETVSREKNSKKRGLPVGCNNACKRTFVPSILRTSKTRISYSCN